MRLNSNTVGGLRGLFVLAAICPGLDSSAGVGLPQQLVDRIGFSGWSVTTFRRGPRQRVERCKAGTPTIYLSLKDLAREPSAIELQTIFTHSRAERARLEPTSRRRAGSSQLPSSIARCNE